MDASPPLTVLVYIAAPAESTHEYLLLRRNPKQGGFWQGVTGAVEAGEQLDEAAIRELTEETGLAPIRLIPLDFHYSVPPGKRGGAPSTEHVFLALLSAKVDPRLDPAEHDAWDWFPFGEAVVWLRWPENVEALRRCEALIVPGPPPASA